MEKRKIRSGVLRSTLAVVVCIGLYGCGGGSDESEADSSVPTPTPVNQGDFWLTAVQPELSEQGDYQAIIDLSRNFQGLSADVHSQVSYISDVFVANSGGGVCLSAFTIPGEKQTFTVDLDDSKSLGTCQFDITVMRNGVTEEQKLIADLTTTPWDTIPAISQALSVGEPAKVIDLATEIGSFITAGYSLSPTAPEVFGDITVTTEGNTLTVTASNNVGPNRIVYQLIKGEESKTGVIDVTVSNPGFKPPEITDKNKHVITNTKEYITINLADGKTIKPGDHSPLQIISVDSPEGGKLACPESDPPQTDVLTWPDCLQSGVMEFRFKSDQVGEYSVNYTVSDHHGGYASSTVIVDAGKVTSPNTELAATPGRMRDRVILTDEYGKRLIIDRPQLFVEMRTVPLPNPIPDGEYNDITGERWGYLSKNVAVEYCTFQGKKPITLTAYQKIKELHAPPGEEGTITYTLGWPASRSYNPNDTNNGQYGWTYYYYYVQETANKSLSGKWVVEGKSATVGVNDRAIPLCVYSPERIMIPSKPSFDKVTTTDTSIITNVPVSGVTCTSANTAVATVECVENKDSANPNNSTVNVTVTAVATGTTEVVISSVKGENITGNEPPLTIPVTTSI